MKNHIYGSKVAQNFHFGVLNRHFKPNIRKIQIASDMCIRLTWNLTCSCSQQQRLRGLSCMVVKQFQDGRRPPFWKLIWPYLSEKLSDFDEILYTAAYFELVERHEIKNEPVALDRLRVRQSVFLVLFLVSRFNFLLIPCGRLSWLPVSFLLHVKYTLSYRIVHQKPSLS